LLREGFWLPPSDLPEAGRAGACRTLLLPVERGAGWLRYEGALLLLSAEREGWG